jgi:hypothetical protein
MNNSVIEMLIAYGFVIALFVGLPAIVFLVVFLPALMRTAGETIGASQLNRKECPVESMSEPHAGKPERHLTMANTA